MIHRSSIAMILRRAVHAPSGDNCQPWQFAVRDNTIYVVNLPDKDTSLYNTHQRASLIAHGALIENILISSSALGLKADVRVFPDAEEPNVVAAIDLVESELQEEPLFHYLEKRVTNRKRYKPTPLTAEQRDSITGAAKDLEGAGVRLIEKSEDKKRIASVLSINDCIAFENPHIHRFLFEHIRWTEKEALRTRDGMYYKTLEVSPLQLPAFRAFGNWALMAMLNKIGISKIIAANARKLCRSASAIGIITIDHEEDAAYITAGRLLQRIWLEATRMGLSFHPMAGLPLLIQRVRSGDTGELSPRHIEALHHAYEVMNSLVGLKAGVMAMTFRIGRSVPPSASSLRNPPEIVS